MGAPDSKQFRGFIPKEQVGEASSWEFASLGGAGGVVRGAGAQLSERDKRAFDRGRAQGLAEGRAEGQATERKRQAGHAAQVDALLNQLRAPFAEMHESAGDALLDLAFTIARQVIRREVAIHPDALMPALREAVSMIVDHHANPRVFLHPHDLETLQADLTADGLFKGCRFVADPRIARGGCRVETAQGEIDATLSSRWERVLASLGAKDGSREVEIPLASYQDEPPQA